MKEVFRTKSGAARILIDENNILYIHSFIDGAWVEANPSVCYRTLHEFTLNQLMIIKHTPLKSDPIDLINRKKS